jgi:hypothetical protein
VFINLLAVQVPLLAKDCYVSPDGKISNLGTLDSPWDLKSTLVAKNNVYPGDTIWLSEGTYRDRSKDIGYHIKLNGTKDKPITILPLPEKRAIIDGGVAMFESCQYIYLKNLEILVSENFTMTRVLTEKGSAPKSYGRISGGVIMFGPNCKLINLIIHDNGNGIGFWSGAMNSEIYGCIIYDNGWKGPDRGHGHAIYTQNGEGGKVISDCIMTGGYGWTMHAYTSPNEPAYVNNYLIKNNICYNGGEFLVGGAQPSHNITLWNNILYGLDMRVGYHTAPYNENCELKDNIIINGKLYITRYKEVINENNLIIGKSDKRPDKPEVKIFPNNYDENRANLVIFNWTNLPKVGVNLGSFLKIGNRYKFLDPKKFFDEPILSGVYDGNSVNVPVKGEFAVFVLIKK